ncbi:MAG: amidohydrolase family protein [Pseudomonadota bacterium]
MARYREHAHRQDPSPPPMALPPLACDCHVQVIGPREVYPFVARAEYMPEDAPRAALFLRDALLGLDRGVLVQASCHGADNSGLLDAVRLGDGAYRGVAILDPRSLEDGLVKLDRAHERSGGVAGIRLDFSDRLHGRVSAEERDAMIVAAAARGWHLEVDATPAELPALQSLIATFPGKVVLTGLGRVAPGDTAALAALCAQLRRAPRLWIKLNPVAGTSAVPPQGCDIAAMTQALLAAAPDRAVWGTGWPHPHRTSAQPDDGALLGHLCAACPDTALLRRVLVENATRLYWPDMA